MGRLRTKSEYEDLRKTRILRNHVLLETPGLQNSISEPGSVAAKPKSARRKIVYSSTPLRRSNRLNGKPCDSAPSVKVENGDDLEEVKANSAYEDLRKARILENQARLESLGLHKTISELQTIISSKPKLQKRKWIKVDYSSSPLRRSSRLKGKPCYYTPSLEVEKEFSPRTPPMSVKTSDDLEEVKANSAYEDLRKARILENQARLESLGLHKTISELQTIISSKPKLQKRKWIKVDYSSSPLRRSSRLKGKPCYYTPSLEVEKDFSPRTPPMSVKNRLTYQPSPEALSRRCSSKARGSVYDPVYGICCHFCRQKKLCGEEDCKHCGDLDMDQPCIGKTECSVCHSSNGVLCRACLKVRYGEEMEEVRANREWICPHCTEEKGINPYWICNSSLCLKKRKMVPTGIAIYRAKKMGFKSVAHLVMDELQRRAHR